MPAQEFHRYDTRKLNEIDIKLVLEHLGVEHDRSGKLYRCPSPDHDDRHPSMSVKNNRWKCFACGKHGNVINLVETYNDCGFKEACEWLQREFCIGESHNSYRARCHNQRTQIRTIKSETSTQRVHKVGNEQILKTIIDVAGLTNEAKYFLFNQRKYSEEVVRGLNVKSIGNNDKFVNFLSTNFDINILLQEKILLKGRYGYYCIWKAPCLLFPFYDLKGHLVNIVSRSLIPNIPHKDKFRSLQGIETLPYNLPILQKAERDEPLCIMEGLTDTIAALSEGKKAIGLHGCTNSLLDYRNVLKDYRLIYYHDNDKAGKDSFADRQTELRNYFIPLKEGVFDASFNDYSEYYSSQR